MPQRMDEIRRQLEEYRQKSAEKHTSNSPPVVSETSSQDPSIDHVQPIRHNYFKRFVSSLLPHSATERFRQHWWMGPLIQFCVWLLLLWGAVRVEFGSVFFVLSLLYLILTNLGTRKPGEPSAYSVFNENCERLPGQITAEQFENEITRRNL